MTDEELVAYLEPLSPQQAAGIRAVRGLIHRLDPGLLERVIDGKWLNGLIGYYADENVFIYALGPRGEGRITFHMMPYYMNAAHHAAHGPALKRFLTGKSCLEFRSSEELPADAIEAILTGGSVPIIAALAARGQRVRGRPSDTEIT